MQECIRIHGIRLRQLKAFALENNISLSQFMDMFVSFFMKDGQIPDRFSEFTADRDGDFVRITVSGHAIQEVTLKDAQNMLAAMCDLITGRVRGVARVPLQGGQAFVVQRVGTAFRLSVQQAQMTVATLLVSPYIMTDICRHIGVHIEAWAEENGVSID